MSYFLIMRVIAAILIAFFVYFAYVRHKGTAVKKSSIITLVLSTMVVFIRLYTV
jgi:hypothetical protein